MKPFTTHTGLIATLNRSNVDTDVIIPKQFLKSIKRTGYGPSAFFDWRYTADGSLDPDFELNQSRFEGRSILVTRNNFGCGSSREVAPVALKAAGVQAVLAEGFARIFYRNAINICLPAIECPGIAAFSDLGDELALDLSAGSIRHCRTSETIQGTPIPDFLIEMMQAGGLVPFLKKKLSENPAYFSEMNAGK